MLPRAVGDGTVPAAGHETLNVLAANVHRGSADPEALVALVDRLHPDVLSIEELTPSFAPKLERAGLGRRLPHSLLALRSGSSGAGLYSRLPLRQLPSPVDSALPDGRRMPRAALTLADGRRVRVVSVHPTIPGHGSVDQWEQTLESLPSAGAGAPWVLAGDFNATLDQSELRAVVDRGYRDAGDVAGKGLEPTFPREGHLIPPITIDHVLADQPPRHRRIRGRGPARKRPPGCPRGPGAALSERRHALPICRQRPFRSSSRSSSRPAPPRAVRR